MTTVLSSRSRPRRREHLSGYQARDYEIVDYRMYELPGSGLQFRGPPLPPGTREYFTCIGAAQTFGCLCPHPYPELLGRALGQPALNLGYGGAGPEFFARQPALIEAINRGRFLVLQVMSGRSQSNRLFESGGLELLTRRSDGASLGANEAYDDLIAGPCLLRHGRLGRALARRLAAPRLRRVVAETREAWVASHRRLLAEVRVPVVLLWFSKRRPAYVERHHNALALFGEFPQLIDQATLDRVKPLCTQYVECVSQRGSPQPLVSRFTGRPTTINPARDRPDLGDQRWTHNHYYPSPEMQEDAAEALRPVCTSLLRAG